MFRKPFKVKTNVLTKNSEKKKIFESIGKFYKLDTSILSTLFNKSKLQKIKIECHNETYSTIYQFDDKPLFFEYSDILVPTVYCLWLICDFVMSFTIYEATTPYIYNGSDLMIPGIIVNKPLNETSYGSFPANELVTINTDKNRAPIAIGLTNMDSIKMFQSSGKGKAVQILHVQGDYLWQFGDKSLPPQIDWIVPEVENEVTEDPEIEDLSCETENVCLDDNIEIVVDNEELVYDADQVLLDCFMHSIKCSLKDKDLPIILNLFYANHVLRFCPDGFVLDIKKTKYKKFGIFMQAMEKEGLVKVTELKKGIQSITSVNRSHENLRFTPTLTYKDNTKEENSDRVYVFPKIEEVYFVTDKSCNILKYEGFKKSDTITPSRLREIVTDYVKRNQLQGLNATMVLLDDVLKSACLKQNENLSEISWKTLFERLHKNMTPGIVMKFDNEVVSYRNMKFPKIRMEATNKNNKMITRIEGAEIFQINVKKLCTDIQQAIGCSCGVVTNKSGVAAIQAQGDQRVRIINILKETYKVPNNFIEGGSNLKTK